MSKAMDDEMTDSQRLDFMIGYHVSVDEFDGKFRVCHGYSVGPWMANARDAIDLAYRERNAREPRR